MDGAAAKKGSDVNVRLMWILDQLAAGLRGVSAAVPTRALLSALLECFVWGCMVPMVARGGPWWPFVAPDRERPGWHLILLGGERAPKLNPILPATAPSS